MRVSRMRKNVGKGYTCMRENVCKGYTYMREDVERLWFERAVGYGPLR